MCQVSLLNAWKILFPTPEARKLEPNSLTLYTYEEILEKPYRTKQRNR